MDRFPFIVILGIDGTGKTSAADELCDVLYHDGVPAVTYDSVESQFPNPTRNLKKNAVFLSPDEQLDIYIRSTLHHGSVINQLTDRSAVIKTRYLDDVLAHHAYIGASTQALQKAEQTPLLIPDLKVLLTVDETERRRRVIQRAELTGVLDERDLDPVAPGTRLYFMQQQYMASIHSRLDRDIHIDTTDKPVSQVVSLIAAHLYTLLEAHAPTV